MVWLFLAVPIALVAFIWKASEDGFGYGVLVVVQVCCVFLFCNNITGIALEYTDLGNQYIVTERIELSSFGNNSNEDGNTFLSPKIIDDEQFYSCYLKTNENELVYKEFAADNVTIKFDASQSAYLEIETHDTEAMKKWFIPMIPMSEKYIIYLPEDCKNLQ